MKDSIVFCLRVDNEESYGEVSNFIYKREKRDAITDEEANRVSYKYYLRNSNNTPKNWAINIIKDIDEFAKIKEPHKIKNITEQYEIVYCIYVDENSDIIDLGNLYLIKQHYTDLNIIVLFPNCDNSRYFMVSQFLYSVVKRDNKFYNECFFIYEGNIQRAQINNISFSRVFTPLQVIDKDNIQRLFQKCKGLVTDEYIHSLFSEDMADTGEYDDILDGVIKIIYDGKKQSSIFFDSKYIQVVQKLDVLAFVLLCYVINQEREKLNLSLLERYAFQMQQYSNSVHQLAENIVFHSKTKCGVIAFRIHRKTSSYIKDKYKVTNVTGSFLEIIVSDFCRDNSLGKISDNFVSNLKNDETKSAFRGLQPRAFFDHDYDVKIKDAWKEFYRNPDNIGKHFGLRIFQSVVSTFGGMFGAESHCGYINMPGDSFLSYPKSETTACMPGTRYHIVFPIENVQMEIKKQDLSLDSGIDISARINDYLSYSLGEIILSCDLDIPQSQQQKNAQIRQMAEYIQIQLEKINKDIVYISLEDIQDNMGEIIAKAITIALFQIKSDLTVVFYQCTNNLKKSIFDSMSIFFYNAEIEGMFYNRNVQIIMYSKNFEETVLDLSSSQNTDNINAYIAHMKCINLVEGYLNSDSHGVDLAKGAACYIPCDVLYKVRINEKIQTLFEHYTEEILKTSIQKKDFGCQLKHTHMRLGSTIHINKFYEAEILFGNKLFVSRFALLLVKDMKEDIKNIAKLTLFGYGTYSETVLVQMIEYIRYIYPKKRDVDYIILEREEERRGFLHKDRIRYNKHFNSDEDRINYFKERKVAIIVLINSTLKTHMRLINLFKEENAISTADQSWLIRNYAVLLVGNSDTNGYWKLKNDYVVLLNENISPTPRYFIQVDAEYQEPEKCQQCFPENPVAEVPLIEVNAASTIPNQAFGIFEMGSVKELHLDYEYIQREEKKLEYLKNEFVYGHVHRNENHFLYYFRTENICIKQKENIQLSLKEWRNKQKNENDLQYNIIVSPMHFSNAGFVELVNNVVFDGNAILLRIDFDKEYRCNAYTKYSYLRNYIEQLETMHVSGRVCVHYVDDAIISGRTFYRAKSLIQSILKWKSKDFEFINIKVFDKVFVLVDRNSAESRKQYVANEKTDFYSFVTVNISSLRNYGDSCVYCNLKKEADLLFSTASTKAIAEYWKHCAEKFQLYSLEEYSEKYSQLDYEKQFRRLFCTHMAQCVLEEIYHGNDHVQVIYLILKLLNTDYMSREKDKFEYFLSYLKCISRPFLVFKKAIKEAIFDIMLILIEATVYNKSLSKVINEIKKDKPYLLEKRLIEQFKLLDKNILQSSDISDKDKKNLVELLMKQLTELKSNYIIRPEKMDAIFSFMSDDNKKEFENHYLRLIDRLVGASSDTNKSIWLDDNLINNEYKYVSDDFKVWIILENTRAFRDGIEKFYKWIYEENMASKEFGKVVDRRISEIEVEYNHRRACTMFDTFEKKYENELKESQLEECLDYEMAHKMKKRIERFLTSLPEFENLNIIGMINSVKQTTDNWSEIFYFFKKQVEEEYNNIKTNCDICETKTKLLACINEKSDMYQFGNFYKLLKAEGYYEETVLSSVGADMVACCVKVLDLCRSKELTVWEKVPLLAILLKVILGAQKVQFIIEDKTNSNLDEWKHTVEKKYNSIIDKINVAYAENRMEKLEIKGKKHYSVIVEKAGSEDFNTEVSDVTEEIIEQLENQSSEQRNYIIDKRYGVVIWKLENNQRSIWINIENDAWRSETPGYEVKVAKSIRKVMMFYQELKYNIFNPENDDFINEISHARKKLSIYDSNKVYTHTKDYTREVLLEKATHFFLNDEDNEKYMLDYPSYVLKLLADINISQYYRYGLNPNFYNDEREFKNVVTWSKFARLIRDKQEFKYCISNNETVNIKLQVKAINKDDEMLCRNSPSATREMFMLIYALILNAAEQNRGKRQSEKTDVQPGRESVIVRIYKDNGYLVIENECEESVDLMQIKRKLQRVPDSEDDGISLWSFNCYIKRCISSIILAKLKVVECEILENQINKKEIQDIGTWINKLTSQEYEIQPEQCEQVGGKVFFRIKIPIFMEKFQLKEERREN